MITAEFGENTGCKKKKKNIGLPMFAFPSVEP